MVRLARCAILLLSVAVLAMVLPNFYWKVFAKKTPRHLIRYSAESDRFLMRSADDHGNTVYQDEDGETFDEITFQTLLPFMYYNNLEKWDLLPDEVNGVEISGAEIKASRQFFRIMPDYLDTPQIDMFPLLESEPVYSHLTLPPEMFRIAGRMEFVDATSNAVNETLSVRYTEALEAQGFVFPALHMAGNPSVRKSFDEGYFVVDAENKLFHIKQVEDEAIVRRTGIAPESGFRYLAAKESGRREFYGWYVTGDDEVFLIGYDEYRPIKVPSDGYVPGEMSFYFYADLMNRHILFAGENVIHCIATDLDYNVVRTLDYPAVDARHERVGRISEFLFPFRIKTRTSDSGYVQFRFEFKKFYGLAGTLLSVVILLVARAARWPLRCNVWTIIWTLAVGIYAIPSLLIAGAGDAADRGKT